MPQQPVLLGHRSDGRPFWAFFGGEGEGGAGDGGTGGGDGGAGDGGAGDEPSVQDQIKAAKGPLQRDLNATRNELRPLKEVLRDLGIDSPEALREALQGKSGPKGGEQVDVEKIKADAIRDANRQAQRQIASAKVESRATKDFMDPEDAVNALTGDLDDFIDKEGKIDTKRIDTALSELLERKPHYGKQKGNGADFDSGVRQTGGKPPTMDNWLREKSRQKRGG